MNKQDMKKYTSAITNLGIKCSCGHTVTMYDFRAKKKLCSHCGHYAYKDKKEEFKDKMREMLKYGNSN